jgi:hypothetical protein
MKRREFLLAPAVLLARPENGKVVFRAGGRPLFEYRYAATRPKAYVHPLYAPDGSVVSLDSPKDHPHHQGLMLAWSDVNGFDFWGELNPAPHGQIVHQRFASLNKHGFTAVNHWIGDGRVLLVERRSIRVPPQKDGTVRLEWESLLEPAREAVTLSAKGHPYNGLGIRLSPSLDHGAVLNSNGTTDIRKADGESARWCAYYGPSGGVAIFDDPANPRYPTPFYVKNDPFGYLSAAPTYREPFRLEPGKSLRLRYTVAAFNGTPPAWR